MQRCKKVSTFCCNHHNEQGNLSFEMCTVQNVQCFNHTFANFKARHNPNLDSVRPMHQAIPSHCPTKTMKSSLLKMTRAPKMTNQVPSGRKRTLILRRGLNLHFKLIFHFYMQNSKNTGEGAVAEQIRNQNSPVVAVTTTKVGQRLGL